jgi:hypothetical protein
LAAAEVDLVREATPNSRIGGRIDLAFGTNADIVASFEPGGGDETFRNLQQAYISVMANDQVTLDFGKFVTPMGAEVIESQANMNYSRSVLFGFAIPFYHTGLRATIAASDQLSLAGYVVNGWNSTSADNNSDKTFIASATLTPNDQMTWYGNFIVGKEGDFGGTADQDLLWVFDTTLSFAATEMVTLMANFDFGSAAEADPVTAGDPATFWGVAAYARLQAQENWALAGRFEYIDDGEGWLTFGQNVQTFTATSDHTVLEDLIARFEFRFDTAENDFFTDADGNPTQNQFSLTAGFVYELQ